MRKWINITLYLIGFVAVVVIGGIILWSKALPEGERGPEAEALTDKMLAAVNEPAWGSLRYVAWTFRDERHYVWDKWYHLAEIRWDDMRVLLNINARDGKVWKDGERLYDEEKRERIATALQYWNNDSFWLNPVVKLRDKGTERRLVERKDGTDALLVTYTEGGTTPGDSYLWIVDDDGLPVKWRMWVSILPVKGLAATWEDWTKIQGALVATQHQIGPFTLTLSNIRSGDHHSDLGLEKDPFTDL